MVLKEKLFGDIRIEDIDGKLIEWKNFAGEKKVNDAGRIVNDEGQRNFELFLDNLDFAKEIAEKGWPVTFRLPKEEYDENLYNDMISRGFKTAFRNTETNRHHGVEASMRVKVRYDRIPPKIVVVTAPGVYKPLDADTVYTLDSMRISTASIILNPYCWPSRQAANAWEVTAYCKTLYVVPEFDDFDDHYKADSND